MAAVTGATGVIGRAIAEAIARRPDWAVVLVVRDAGRGAEAVDAVRDSTGNPDVSLALADLGLAADIAALRRAWEGPLHALVNNAGATPRSRRETAEGVEVQWGVNVLGYWRMARAFRDVLAASAPSRLVNVASYWAGGLDLDDPEFRRRRYDNDDAYRQSKQADRMMSLILAEAWAEVGIAVNACHPGDVRSRLAANLGFGGAQSASQAADTPAWLAVDPEADGLRARWVSGRMPGREPYADSDLAGLERLLESYG